MSQTCDGNVMDISSNSYGNVREKSQKCDRNVTEMSNVKDMLQTCHGNVTEM